MNSQCPGWVNVSVVPNSPSMSGLSYKDPSVIFGNWQLSISRPDNSWSAGADFSIFWLNRKVLMNLIYEARANVSFSLKGSFLGSVAALRGRPACDEGTLSLPIVAIDLSIQFQPKNICVAASGELGPMLPWTSHSYRGTPKETGGSFDVGFTIPDEILANVCGDSAATIIADRDRYILARA